MSGGAKLHVFGLALLVSSHSHSLTWVGDCSGMHLEVFKFKR